MFPEATKVMSAKSIQELSIPTIFINSILQLLFYRTNKIKEDELVVIDVYHDVKVTNLRRQSPGIVVALEVGECCYERNDPLNSLIY